jgi:hypothetical protein
MEKRGVQSIPREQMTLLDLGMLDGTTPNHILNLTFGKASRTRRELLRRKEQLPPIKKTKWTPTQIFLTDPERNKEWQRRFAEGAGKLEPQGVDLDVEWDNLTSLIENTGATAPPHIQLAYSVLPDMTVELEDQLYSQPDNIQKLLAHLFNQLEGGEIMGEQVEKVLGFENPVKGIQALYKAAKVPMPKLPAPAPKPLPSTPDDIIKMMEDMGIL